jgi:hypothetical protein
LTLFFWIGCVVPLVPLLSPATAKRFAAELDTPELKGVDPIYDLSPQARVAVVTWTFRKEFAKGLVFPIIGVLSAVLLLARRRVGRFLAIALCSLCFSLWLIGLIRLATKANFSLVVFQILTPGGVYFNIVGPLFFALSVLLLTRGSTGHWFDSRHLTSGWSRPR